VGELASQYLLHGRHDLLEPRTDRSFIIRTFRLLQAVTTRGQLRTLQRIESEIVHSPFDRVRVLTLSKAGLASRPHLIGAVGESEVDLLFLVYLLLNLLNRFMRSHDDCRSVAHSVAIDVIEVPEGLLLRGGVAIRLNRGDFAREFAHHHRKHVTTRHLKLLEVKAALANVSLEIEILLLFFVWCVLFDLSSVSPRRINLLIARILQFTGLHLGDGSLAYVIPLLQVCRRVARTAG